jgi:hypothetical protein
MVNRGLATVSSESDGGSRVRSPLIEGERKNRSLAAPRQKQLITSSSQARKVKDRFSGDQVTEDELKQFCRAKLLRIDPSRRSEFPELEDGPEPKRVRRISPHKKMIVFNLLSTCSMYQAFRSAVVFLIQARRRASLWRFSDLWCSLRGFLDG